jgi:hypothetical protein
MADGSRKPISQIKVGDRVLATNPLTGAQSARKVTHVWVHQDTVIRLNVAGEILVTTEDHQFWNATDRAWERADAIDRGDLLGTADGHVAKYRRLFGRPRQTTVYNLTVQGVHTYHVGHHGLLVHNGGPCSVAANASEILPKPIVGDAKLQNYVDDLYKGTTNPGRVGTGTTADAVRAERLTGQPTFGKFHTQKAEDTARGLRNWLRRNPGADPHDLLVAQSLRDELVDALGSGR